MSLKNMQMRENIELLRDVHGENEETESLIQILQETYALTKMLEDVDSGDYTGDEYLVGRQAVLEEMTASYMDYVNILLQAYEQSLNLNSMAFKYFTSLQYSLPPDEPLNDFAKSFNKIYLQLKKASGFETEYEDNFVKIMEQLNANREDRTGGESDVEVKE